MAGDAKHNGSGMRPLDVHVLLYHHVVPRGEADGLAPFLVYPDMFERQLSFLSRVGFRSVQLGDILNALEGRSEMTGKSVVITFDDGPMNVFDHAVPILKSYGFTATFFVSPALLSTTNSWDVPEMPRVPLMGRREVRKLAEDGFEIGSHGMHHTKPVQLDRAELRKELCDSRVQMQNVTGIDCEFFSYPFGEYPDDYATLCSQAGYRAAVGMTSPANRAVEDPYAVRRVLIHTYDTLIRFRLKMTPAYLRLLSWRERRYHRRSRLLIQS
jgi:peptidoglycan/xylan/chitin deacetylase (PgdA/CDA1 family)